MSEPVTAEKPAAAPKVAGAASEAPRRRRILRVGLLIALIIAAVVVWRAFFQSAPVPDSIVALSGRIEGDDSAVAPKTAGRIANITVREGDQVKAGQIIATLDDEQVRAREQQARAALIAAQAKSASAQAQVAVLEEQLRQFQLQTEQARVDANGRV